MFQPFVRQPEDILRSRYGHSLVACSSDSLYMFGGYSLKNGLLKDVWMFNITTSKWIQIVPFTMTEPNGRLVEQWMRKNLKGQIKHESSRHRTISLNAKGQVLEFVGNNKWRVKPKTWIK